MDIYAYMLLSKQERQKHIKLKEPCQFGNTYMLRCLKELLATYLHTGIPNGHMILCCHACNDGRCTNLNHVYFGTPKENSQDGLDKARTKTRIEVFCYPEVKQKLKDLCTYYEAQSITNFIIGLIEVTHAEMLNERETKIISRDFHRFL